MRWHWYFSALALAGGACVAAYALYVWRRRRASAGASLAVVLAAAGWWGLAYAIELGASRLSTKLFWGDAKWLGIALLPPAWFAFIMQYTGRGRWVNRYTITALLIPSVGVIVLLANKGTHDLVRYYPPSAVGDPDAIAQVGPLFWPFLVYADLVVWGSTALFVWTLTHVSRLYWRQSLLLIVTVLLPSVANVVHNLNLGPFGRVEPTPFLFVLTGTVLVWGIFRFRLLDLAPIVRGSVLETIQDGVVVLDPYRRVVNLNPAAERALGVPTAEAVGRQAEALLAVEPSLLDGGGPGQVVLRARRHELTSTPLRDRGGRETGRVVVLRDVTERQRAHDRLVRLDEQRRWLLGRLVSRQERERRRLAGQLRQVDPRLRMAASGLDRLRASLDRPDQVELVEGLRGAIIESLGRLRQLAFELRPPPLDRIRLAEALGQYARSVGEQAGFRVHVEDYLDRDLPAVLREVAYRIAQEALANVAAHAHAQRVTIWLDEADEGGLHLRVSDDGVGFLPDIGRAEPGPEHLGIVSMREQAAMVGGSCKVASSPGMGTTVELLLPVPPAG
ncbi:MAG TPA: histidine kinase N-terminal 7TM domain-containing protein [Actinomycetes bacterium]